MEFLQVGNRGIASWVNGDIDAQAYEQAKNIANLPFLHKYMCLMPDAHGGYGMPIGGVAALVRAVSPSMVGVDIGCGMRAFNTGVSIDEFLPKREEILDMVFDTIPVGMKWHLTVEHQDEVAKLLNNLADQYPVLSKELQKVPLQLGTMGGNNHFIEFQVDGNGMIWVMLHSGSRNLGKRVCDHYDKKAKEINASYHTVVPTEWNLAFLPWDTQEARDYFREMTFCLKFARMNRKCMAKDIRNILTTVFSDVKDDVEYDIHHNYAAWENHFGKNVIVHRKGAVKAEGVVIIPGCMETRSYICQGLGNEKSFRSCSHGAGRTMSRKAAVKQYDAQSIVERMKANDISFRKPSVADIAEESMESYKPVESVMDAQRELVIPTITLKTIGVIKG